MATETTETDDSTETESDDTTTETDDSTDNTTTDTDDSTDDTTTETTETDDSTETETDDSTDNTTTDTDDSTDNTTTETTETDDSTTTETDDSTETETDDTTTETTETDDSTDNTTTETSDTSDTTTDTDNSTNDTITETSDASTNVESDTSDTEIETESSQDLDEIESYLKDYPTTSEMESYVSSEISNLSNDVDNLTSTDVLKLINDNSQTDDFSDLETLTNKKFMGKNIYRRMFIIDYTVGQEIQKFTRIEDELFKIDLGLAFKNFEEIEEIFLVDFFETSTYSSGNVYTASSATAFYEDEKHKRYSLISKTKKEVVFGNNMENLVATKTYLIFEYTKI